MYIALCMILWYNRSGKILRKEKDMPYNESQKKATMKYIKANLEEIRIRVRIGRKEIIKAHAEKQGESLSKFLNRAINETMERDNAKAEE